MFSGPETFIAVTATFGEVLIADVVGSVVVFVGAVEVSSGIVGLGNYTIISVIYFWIRVASFTLTFLSKSTSAAIHCCSSKTINFAVCF